MKRLSKSLLCFTAVAFGLCLAAPSILRAVSPIWATPALAELIEEGLTHNQEIQSMEDRVESLKEEVSFAGSLEDPRLGFGVLNLPTDTFDFDQEPMTQKVLFISQRVPWFGTLGLKSKKTTLLAVQQQAVLEAKRLELARKIANSYFELGFVATNLEINERLTNLVSQLLRVAETKYASGEGLQQDVLQAQVELSKLLDEKIVLKRRHRTLEDQINELLNRESFLPVKPPEDLAYLDTKLEFDALTRQSLFENPWLGVRQAEIDQATVEIELAKKDYWPDMDFRLAYGQRDEDLTGRDLPDFFSATVTLSIPLWQKSRQNKRLSASIKSYEAAMKSYRNLVDSLPHRVDALATEIMDTQENYRLYVDALLVQSEQWARSSLAAYGVGKVEFNTMINAQIHLLRVELQAKRYLFRIYQKRAELEEVLGGPIRTVVSTKRKS
jgi:outer membrane protein TolC